MTYGRKIRCEDTWAEVRRAWEGGETGASLARRYDVGLANLWRRRASEGWLRHEEADPEPEPPMGWDRHAAVKLDAFWAELEATRELAQDLMQAMQGGPIESAPLWHLSFLYAWRAEHLGADVARLDREQAQERDKPWAALFWDADGRLKPLPAMDQSILVLNRDVWRKGAGLPEGAAPHYP